MTRTKLRKRIAYSLYSEKVRRLWAQLGIEKSEEEITDHALDLYINEYYPGKYIPYEDETS
jgi:hypothetical protein